ncbi:trypsin-like peptidase domain-containing protein [Geodermatophilus sp. SYSU D00779]
MTAAFLVAAIPVLGGTAAATEEPAPTPSTTAAPLPSVTPEGRASDLVAPATAFVQVNWSAYVSIDGETWLPEPVTWTIGCTAVVVDSDGLLVTAGHCLDDGWDMGGAKRTAVELLIQQAVDAQEITQAEGAQIQEQVLNGGSTWRVEGSSNESAPDRRVYVTLGGGRAPWSGDPATAPSGLEANVLDVKPWSQGDVGLLKVQATNLPVAVLAEESNVQIGQDLLAVGYPLELATPDQSGAIALTNRQGSIGAVDTQGQHGPGNRFYSTNIDSAQGMSGGPAVNFQGQVVGLTSTVVGQSTSFIVPSSVVLENFAGRIDNTPGHVDELYQQGLTAYYAGYYSDAISSFEEVLLLVPDLPSVADKKVEAAQRREQFGDQPKPVPPTTQRASRMPWRAIAIGGGLTAVVVGLTVVGLVHQRRRRRGGQENVSPVPAPVPSDDAGTRAEPAPGDADVGTEVDPDADGRPSEWVTPPVEAGNGRPADHRETAAATLDLAPGPVMTRSAGRFCRSCGASHDPGDAFCSECGANLRRPV